MCISAGRGVFRRVPSVDQTGLFCEAVLIIGRLKDPSGRKSERSDGCDGGARVLGILRDESLELRSRQRRAEEIPLHFVAALVVQKSQLLVRLHALGDDADLQPVRDIDDRGGHGRIAGVMINSGDE